MKFFGSEPARWVGIIGALVTALAAFKNPVVDAGSAAAIVALLSAALTAYTTRPVTPALLSGVIAALAAVISAYGLDFSDAQVGAVTGVVLAVANIWAVRDQVTAQDTALSSRSDFTLAR